MLETWFRSLETRVVWVSDFQKSACLLTFISGKFLPKVDEDTFNVFISNCKMSREFCHSLMGSRHRGYCHKNHLGIRAGSLFKILVAREQIEGASGNRAPVRQQPGHVQGIIHHSPLPPPVLAARCHCQRAKKVVSDSPGPVDFAIGLVTFVPNLPNGQGLFFGEIQITEGL